MPNVPYDPTPNVAPRTDAGNDYITTQASPADFGAQIGAATQGLGGMLERTGDQAAAVAMRIQQLHNNLAADNATTAQQVSVNKILFGDPNDPTGSPGFYNLRGKAALDARPGVEKALEDSRNGIAASLQNDAQRFAFNEASRRVNFIALQGVGSHYAQEFQRYGTESQNAAIQVATQTASNNYNNDAAFATSLDTALAAADKRSALAGLDDNGFNAARQAVSEQMYSARAVALGAADPGAALRFVTANRTEFDAQRYLRLTEEFKTKANAASDNAYVAGLIGGARPAGDVASAIFGQESNSGANPSTSVAGARGGWQIMPETFKQYARPGENIDNPADNQAVGKRIIDDLSTRAGGDPARIAVGYFSGPGNIAPPGSATPYIEDKADATGKKTSGYVADVLARMNGAGAPVAGGSPSARGAALASPAYPDESALVRQVVADNPDPERQAARLGKLTQALSTLRLATDTDRRALTDSLPDLQAAALAGQDIVIPEQRIHALLPPAQAQHELDSLRIAQSAGQVFKSVQWGTPEQLAQAYQDLSTGIGPRSDLIRAKGVPAGAAAPGLDQETPEAYRQRTGILALFQKQVTARQAALADDPANYVATNPTVASAAAAVRANPGDLAAMGTYAAAVHAVQTTLGVPEDQQRLLPKAESQALAQRLLTGDPAKMDAGAALDRLAQNYGAEWPAAWHDMVRDGHMPPEWQVLGSLPPGPDRTGLQRALQAAQVKGGLEAMRKEIDPTAAQAIDQGLDGADAMTDFRGSVFIPGLGGDVGTYSAVRSAARTFAYYRVLNGESTSTALTNATQAVLPYDFEGTARAPKGQGALASQVAANVLAGVTGDSLAPVGGGLKGERPADIQNAYARDLRARGVWVTDPRGDGWVLAKPGTNGTWDFPLDKSGNRIGFKFADMARMAASAGVTDPGQQQAGP